VNLVSTTSLTAPLTAFSRSLNSEVNSRRTAVPPARPRVHLLCSHALGQNAQCGNERSRDYDSVLARHAFRSIVEMPRISPGAPSTIAPVQNQHKESARPLFFCFALSLYGDRSN